MKKGTPKLKTKIPSLPQIPTKIKLPKVKPLGGEQVENPPVVPSNSQKGIKSRVPLDVPGVKLR